MKPSSFSTKKKYLMHFCSQLYFIDELELDTEFERIFPALFKGGTANYQFIKMIKDLVEDESSSDNEHMGFDSCGNQLEAHRDKRSNPSGGCK